MNLFKNQKVWAIALLATGMSFISCSNDDDNNEDPASVTLEEKVVLKQYVDNVIVDTYKNLSDASLKLEEAVKALEATPNQDNVNKACEAWKKARRYWESSEAFLFGAAADYGIDPHIDSWPLDKSSLDNLLSDNNLMQNFDTSYAIDNLNGGLLGFHALEYVLFRDGQPRPINQITASTNELKYAIGVAGDLAVQTVRLEAGWAGIDNVTDQKKQLLESYELEPTINYGEDLKLSGQPGSRNKTGKAGIEAILSGSIDIADEVGNAKITDPVESKNVLDVESWYSWNSLTDFVNNIISIENSYLGGVEGKRDEMKSISSYLKKKDATLDSEIRAAIKDAKEQIKGIGEPFRNHLNESDAKKAIDACNTLMNKLEKAKEVVSK